MKIICDLILGLCLLTSVAAAAEPTIQANAAIVVELSGGRVIYAKNADEQRYPASMTKIMTCLLAMETLEPTATALISPYAAGTEDSFSGLQAGDELTVANLLKCLMLESDNGAAVALAERIDGSVSEFAKHMNEKAGAIGCTNTHFNNPNGLPDADHYTTARDMAQIAAYAMRREDFRSLVGRINDTATWLHPVGKSVWLTNTNNLLTTYDGATGIKTGWTNAAGGCLAASAKRNGVTLLTIVMLSPDPRTRFVDAAKLLDYGFSQIKMTHALSKERVEQTIWIENGKNYRLAAGPAEDVSYPMLTGEKKEDFSLVYKLPRLLPAPVVKGDKVGELLIKHQQEVVGKIDIIARESVEEGFSIISYFIGLLAKLFVK